MKKLKQNIASRRVRFAHIGWRTRVRHIFFSDRENYESGFSTVEIIIVIIVISLVGGLGLYVWHNRASNITATKLQTFHSEPEKSNLTECQKKLEPANFNVKHTKPSGWVVNDTYPNGISYKSPDFKSEIGFKGISSGAEMSLTIAKYCPTDKGTEADLLAQATINTNETKPKTEFTTFSGYKVIKFTYNTGENHNNHQAAVFFKGDTQYSIFEEYKYNSPNPYPNAVDDILNSIKF